MKALLITVAGVSSRFNASLPSPVLKCLYNRGDVSDSLLYNALSCADGFDALVVVGGYKFAELAEFIAALPESIRKRVTLVENREYAEYGTGISLKKGLDAVAALGGASELVFAEGDLYFAPDTLSRIASMRGDVLTYNRLPIEAERSVLFYIDASDKPNYTYDTGHRLFSIDKAFKSVYNSAQIWKFSDVAKLLRESAALSEKEARDTNLHLVERYFASSPSFSVMQVNDWVNCNTLEDYDAMLAIKRAL